MNSNQPETGIGVKKANVVEQVSKDVYKQRLQCLARSMKDIVWWAENFFHIVTLDKGLTKIKLYPKQKELLNFIVGNRRIITLSARQCGKCHFFDTKLSVRNKHSKVIQNITVFELFNIAKQQSFNQPQLPSEKFIATYNLDDYEILSDDGWKNIVKVHKTVQYDVWQVTTEKHVLKCADTHIMFDQHMNQVYAKDLTTDSFIMTENGSEKVISVQQFRFADNMYDVELDNNSDHRYYTNGILSHNTTTYTVFCLWLTTLFKDKRILICANKLATASDIMQKLRKSYEELPFWIKPGCISYAKNSIEFSNGSSIRAFSTSSSGARGASGNCLILDEAGFIPKNIMEEFWASIMPIVSSSKKSKVIIVSTPNGASGKFYELWQAANSKEIGGNKEGWQPFRINWWEVPGRDEEWKAQRIASEGMQVWKQEYECDFLTSSSIHKLIADEVIQKYRQKQAELKASGAAVGKKQTIMAETSDKLYEFTVWHEFKKNHTYLASGDISEGVGGDSSVLYVWDVTDLSNITQCAKFASNVVSVVEFAFVISRILKLYNNPYFVAERNGISGGTLDALRITYKYPRLVREGKNGEPGVYSHVVTKGKACIWAKEMFSTEGFGFTFYDHDILDEADTFVKKDTSGVHVVYHALPPAHDDFMMSLIWLCYVLKNEIVEKYFQVQEAFKSANDVVYAKRLAPLQDYTVAELKAVTDDPLYKQYLEFKKEMHATLKDVLRRGDQKEDVFGFSTRNEDMYFGGFDDSPSWNAPNLQLPPSQLGTENQRPQFYFSGGAGFNMF